MHMHMHWTAAAGLLHSTPCVCRNCRGFWGLTGVWHRQALGIALMCVCRVGSGNRMATAIIYLENSIEGGETDFMKIDTKVKPEAGSAVLFYDLKPSGEVDKLTIHAGTKPEGGEKWVATKWIHERQYQVLAQLLHCSCVSLFLSFVRIVSTRIVVSVQEMPRAMSGHGQNPEQNANIGCRRPCKCLCSANRRSAAGQMLFVSDKMYVGFAQERQAC
jgi:hypothetical protein